MKLVDADPVDRPGASPPARGRGLKHLTAYGLQPKKLVSPRVEGA